jgi:GNAT superfamily N-acetyltransferase
MKNILIKEEQYKRLVKHIKQPDGISCGPTCIKMVADFFKGNISSISEICIMCETDSITGTPPERMRKGLNRLGIEYVEHIDEERPYESLRAVIDNGSVAMLRTFTHRVPHWIVIDSYDADVFFVNDPWLGEIEYNEEELEEIWKERNFFFFEVVKDNGQKDLNEEISGNIQIRSYNESDLPKIFNMLEDVYSKLAGATAELIFSIISNACGNDFSDSVVITVDDEVAGFYFLTPDNLPEKDEITSDMFGIQGVALGVAPEFKNFGLGKMLINYPSGLGYDYIWGYQLKQLDNISDWLKRRKIYLDNEQMFITYQIFN